jgi:hypothetical protein
MLALSLPYLKLQKKRFLAYEARRAILNMHRKSIRKGFRISRCKNRLRRRKRIGTKQF